MMRKIIYDFAMTLDGFIARRDGSIDDFPAQGPHVEDYYARLKSYDTVLMGRRTYELGYRYGLVPGDRAYPHMQHYVFSSSLSFDRAHDLTIVGEQPIRAVRDLKARPGSDIYLCGGSQLAGLLLEHKLIDRLIVKLNPILLGHGLCPFAASAGAQLHLTDSHSYPNGVVLLRYDVSYLGHPRSPPRATRGGADA